VQRDAKRDAAPALALDRQQWRIQGITDERRQRWIRAYPGIDLDAEIARAEEWCRANPDRAPHKRIDRFLASWFSRAADAARPKKVAASIPNHEPQPQRPQGPITEGSLDWPRVSDILAVRCDSWRDWESRVTYVGDRDGRAVLMAPDDFSARWLRDNLQSIIEEAIYDVAGQHRPVEVLGGEP